MPTPCTRELLLKAMAMPLPEAGRYWREWRASADLTRFDRDAMLMLPMLSDRLPAWVAGDPARGLLLGICKRAWSNNQLVLNRVAGVAAAMRRARIDPVALAGSAAWSFVYRPAIRPIESVELLIRRHQIPDAARVLKEEGWSATRDLPSGGEMDRLDGIWFRAGEDYLKLGWRLLPASPEIAADYERVPNLTPVTSQQLQAALLPGEELLLQALAGKREACDADWRCDALRLLQSRTLNWRRMRRLLRDEPEARLRLAGLREDWNLTIPAALFRECTSLEILWRDYRWRAWERRRERSLAGFAGYLCERWWHVFVRAR